MVPSQEQASAVKEPCWIEFTIFLRLLRVSRMKHSSGSSGHHYRAGNIFAFMTSPLTEYSAKKTGRYAALKILGKMDEECVCFAVFDGIFDHHPSLEELSGCSVLRSVRFSYEGEPAVSSTHLEEVNDLEDFRYVGHVEVSPAEVELRNQCRSYGSWNHATIDAEGEWRWCNDRDQVENEFARSKAARDEDARVEQERYEQRLKTLSWEKLRQEEPFPRWDTHPPFPPPAFVALARKRIHAAALELRELGTSPKKRDVRTVLRSCVEWFNAKDAEFDFVIETEEREDICQALFELATLARHGSLIAEVNEWRDW